jgi:hypothetical protein
MFAAIRRAFSDQNRQGRDSDVYLDLCIASRHIPGPKVQALSVKKSSALPQPL